MYNIEANDLCVPADKMIATRERLYIERSSTRYYFKCGCTRETIKQSLNLREKKKKRSKQVTKGEIEDRRENSIRFFVSSQRGERKLTILWYVKPMKGALRGADMSITTCYGRSSRDSTTYRAESYQDLKSHVTSHTGVSFREVPSTSLAICERACSRRQKRLASKIVISVD